MRRVTTTIRRLIVLAPNWLGDVVMSLPALEAVRHWLPDAHLAVAARAPVAPLLTLVPGIDEVVTLQPAGGLRHFAAGQRHRAMTRARLCAGEYDAALLLPNSFHAAWLVWRAGIPARWGYRADLRGRLLTRAIPRPTEAVHQAEYYARLVRALGAPSTPLAARLDVPGDARRRAGELLAREGGERRPLAGFAPGAASGPAKRWPPDRVGAVAAALARDEGLLPVFIGAPGDAPAVRQAIAAYRLAAGSGAAPVVDLAGRTDLVSMAAVLSACRVVVSNDSGAMHVAAAVGTPVVALFGPTDERATAPLPYAGRSAPGAVLDAATPAGNVAVITGEAWCRPCHLRVCPLDHRCMHSIGIERVVAAAMSVKRPHAGEAAT